MNTFKRFTISLLALFLMSSAFSYSKKDLYNAVRALNESHVSKILKVSPELSKLKFDADGNSILMIAIQYGCNDKIIDHILRAGCSPDLKNKNGQTAIMFACNYGTSKKTLKRLIEFNVFTSKGKINRILLKDKHGKNAFDYCADNKNLYDFLSTYTLDPATIKTEPISTMPEPEPPLEEQPEEDSVQEPEEEPEILEEAAEPEPAVSEAEISQDEVSVEEIPESVKEEDEPFMKPETEPVIEPVPAPVPEPEEVVSEQEEVVPEQEEVVSEPEEFIPEQEEVVPEPEETEPEPEPEAVPDQEETEPEPEPEAVPDQEEIEETISVEPEPEALPEEIQEEPETIEETSSEAEITTPIEVPQIDYYNSKRPEYLFDEIETEYLLEDEDEVLDDIRESKVRVIENPDALDNVGRTRLMNAIMENDDRVCYILLESGANPNAQDKDGWTPLMYACRYAQTSTVIQLLFEYGAKLDAKSNYQVSVLQIAAAYSKNRKVLATVLEQAANLKLNLQDSFITALKEARSEEFIGEYLKYNLNLNSMYKGKTPLMYAAEYYESTDVIKLLLEKGADPYIISSEKKNAFSYAKENSKLIHDSVYWSLNVSSSKKR